MHADYTAIQLNIQQGISPVYTNAGNAKIKGAERVAMARGYLSLRAEFGR